MNTYELIARFLPVFLLFILGYIFRRTNFLAPKTASELKKLAANITLPALLIKAFASMDPGLDELWMALFMFALCCAILAISLIVMRLSGKRGDCRGYIVAGFEAGMLGYGLFLTMFGNEALPVFASVDLGQLLFVLIVLISAFLGRTSSTESGIFSNLRFVLTNIVRSPFVWAVVSGLVIGWIGRNFDVPEKPLVPIIGFLDILGSLTVPLIALAIGFELNFDRKIIGRALKFVLIRKIIMISIAVLVIRLFPVDNPLTRFAFLTMFLMPPPFVITLIAPDEEQGLVSGILSLSTVISIPLFAVALLITGA